MSNRFARVARRFPRPVEVLDPVKALAYRRKAAARAAARADRVATVARDASGAIRRGRVEVTLATVAIWLPHRAVSPNRGTHGAHWSASAAVRLAWEKRIDAAVDATNPIRRLAPGSLFPTPASRVDWVAPTGVAKVTGTRWVKQPGHLIRDRDNLAFAFKGLTDAVVAAGFLLDDKDAAIERLRAPGEPAAAITIEYRQGISPDGLEWTSYEIDATGRGEA